MSVLTCAQARPHLIRALQSDKPSVLAPDMCEHLEVCPVCQTAVLLINTLALPRAPEPIDCASCEEGLAAFIECERELGWLAAQRAHPNVWWHVWTCADCSETYDLVQVMVVAEQRGELALPEHPTPAARLRTPGHCPDSKAAQCAHSTTNEEIGNEEIGKLVRWPAARPVQGVE